MVSVLEPAWRFWSESGEIPLSSRCGRCFSRGDAIPLDGDGLWQVGQGIVQLSMCHPTGEEVLVGLAGPTAPFGLCFTSLAAYQAKALSDVYLLWFSMKELETSAHLAQHLLPQVIRRLQQSEAMLAISAGPRRVEDRLRYLLGLLAREIGERSPEGHRLAVRLTHQSLASAIGTSRVTCTRLLGKFQRLGWVGLDRERHLVITPLLPLGTVEC